MFDVIIHIQIVGSGCFCNAIDNRTCLCTSNSIESSAGAKASAIIYSLVETVKANYLNVYEYFELLLTEIPQYMNDTDLSFCNNLHPPFYYIECISQYFCYGYHHNPYPNNHSNPIYIQIILFFFLFCCL